MGEKQASVKVRALKDHTYNGENYEAGDVYDFYPVNNPSGLSADAQIASLQSTGFAQLADADAKPSAKKSSASAKAKGKK